MKKFKSLNFVSFNLSFFLIRKKIFSNQTSATLLDHIFSNSDPESKECGIIYSSLSDHLPVFSLSKCTQNEDNIGSKPVLIRNTSIENKTKCYASHAACSGWYQRVFSLFIELFPRC